jgi:hypothetical protein
MLAWRQCLVHIIYRKASTLLVHLNQRSMGTIAITWRPSSVVCKLFTFQASSPKPLGQLEPNLAGMLLGWSSTKLLFFVLVGYSTWLPEPMICSDWLKFQRSSSLKLMNWLNPNCKWRPSWIFDWHKKLKVCRGPSNDHSWAVWFELFKWFQRRSVLKLGKGHSNDHSFTVWVQSVH